MTAQAKNNLDWIAKGFIAFTCVTAVGLLISMRADLTTVMVRTEGIDKTLMQYEKRFDGNESSIKSVEDKIYNLKICCP